jgi:hypothetical protein
MYKYKVTKCRGSTNSGAVSTNDYYDASSASKCTPNLGRPTCSGCTSVSGCMFSSDINRDPGRAALGSCSLSASGAYVYKSPSSCESAGEAYESQSSIWLTIIPLLLLLGYVLNAIAVCIVAKKRGSDPNTQLHNCMPVDIFTGSNPCAWLFIALLCVVQLVSFFKSFSHFSHIQRVVLDMPPLLHLQAGAPLRSTTQHISPSFLTAQQPAPSSVIPITAASNSTAFVPPLHSYGQGGYPYPQHAGLYGSHPPIPGSCPPNWQNPNANNSLPHQQQPPLVPHSTAYIASPVILQQPPNPYGKPVFTSKPL